jgi:hypothetical protein
VKAAGLRRSKERAPLELAAQEGRVLLSPDGTAMTRHYSERLAHGKPAPGLMIVPQHPGAAGEIVESPLPVWTA